ncbi:MAG TPA: 50S ribosomal protein L6 [Candidatus Thermoplasmatota archaeon]|nr:50S ribosomal protein L6 [Candidatus Thermoplasmatota archaeon]
MAIPEAKDVIHVPQGVSVTLAKDGKVTVKGPNGTLERTFRHPDIIVEKAGNDVVVRADYPVKKIKALVGTWGAHIRNMVAGSQKDYEYKMKVVFAHFPIKTKVAGDYLTIENFLGEKTARKARIIKGAKVKVGAEEIIVTGPDVEVVSQTAANIEQATKVRGFDVRVFQDGIYIETKGA